MTELINEGLSINIILKNISTLNSPAYDMMQGSRGIYAGLAGHNFRMSQMQKREKHNFMTVPFSHFSHISQMSQKKDIVQQIIKELKAGSYIPGTCVGIANTGYEKHIA